MLSDPETKELMQRKFDLLILDGAFPDCAFALVHSSRAPFMYVNTVGYYMANIGMAGNPAPFSVTPVLFGTNTDHMNFLQRIQNLAMSSFVAITQQVNITLYILPSACSDYYYKYYYECIATFVD